MPLPRLRTAAATTLALTASYALPAAAAPTCVSPDEFNSAMQAGALLANDVTVSFTVTGVDPGAFPKGALVELADTRCTIGWSGMVLKVYGTENVGDTAHPPGSVKEEHNSRCSWLHEGGELMAMSSELIFAGGGETHHVTVWLRPNEFGYDIDDGAHVQTSANDYGLATNRISLLELVEGGWSIGANVTDAQVCYEPAATASLYATFGASDDATARASAPDSPEPDGVLLEAGNAESEAFMAFDVGAIDGRIERAWLFTFSRSEASAPGNGLELQQTEADWTEATLTWNARPTAIPGVVDAIGAFGSYRSYAYDVTSRVASGLRTSFVLRGDAGNVDPVELFSSEGGLSAWEPPTLLVEYVQVDADADGYFDGPDCNDGDGAVNPAAAESCDGAVDENCNGLVDEGCGGEGGGGGEGGTGATGGAASTGATGGSGLGGQGGDASPVGDEGCGCRTGGNRTSSHAAWALALATGVALRRSRKRLAG